VCFLLLLFQIAGVVVFFIYRLMCTGRATDRVVVFTINLFKSFMCDIVYCRRGDGRLPRASVP
jgi:hypothetical protein